MSHNILFTEKQRKELISWAESELFPTGSKAFGCSYFKDKDYLVRKEDFIEKLKSIGVSDTQKIIDKLDIYETGGVFSLKIRNKVNFFEKPTNILVAKTNEQYKQWCYATNKIKRLMEENKYLRLAIEIKDARVEVFEKLLKEFDALSPTTQFYEEYVRDK